MSYVYPIIFDDLITNMSLLERARWISETFGADYSKVVKLLSQQLQNE